jgi:hypothetical protein
MIHEYGASCYIKQKIEFRNTKKKSDLLTDFLGFYSGVAMAVSTA